MNEHLLELESIQHSIDVIGKELPDAQRCELLFGDDPVFIDHL